jgi:ATP-binding cassette subfamily B protein
MGGMGRGPGGMALGGEKARDFRGTMKKLLNYINAYRTSMIIVLVFAAASSIFSIIGPKILGNVTTKLFVGALSKISGAGSGIDFNYIRRTILFLASLYLLSALFSYIQGWVMTGVAMKVSYNFRRDISEKINRMPLGYVYRPSVMRI